MYGWHVYSLSAEYTVMFLFTNYHQKLIYLRSTLPTNWITYSEGEFTIHFIVNQHLQLHSPTPGIRSCANMSLTCWFWLWCDDGRFISSTGGSHWRWAFSFQSRFSLRGIICYLFPSQSLLFSPQLLVHLHVLSHLFLCQFVQPPLPHVLYLTFSHCRRPLGLFPLLQSEEVLELDVLHGCSPVASPLGLVPPVTYATNESIPTVRGHVAYQPHLEGAWSSNRKPHPLRPYYI